MKKKNKFLTVVDNSYFQYFCIFGAVNTFQKRHADEAAIWLKPIEECDQENLPDLLNCDLFRRVLKNTVMKRLETVDSILRQNFQDQLDACDEIDTVFAVDDKLKHNFRLDMYPSYKATRLTVPRQYKVSPIKDYIGSVIYKELDLEDKYGYRFVQVEGAEGDDVVATALTRFKDDYEGAALIASDHDFLQIDGIREFDLMGRELKRELGGESVAADEFLLGKILMGDKSDNIKQVFAKCGPKTALKYVRNKEGLDKLLKEDQQLADRFLLNSRIISFKEMPKDLSDKVYKKLSEALYKEDALNERTDYRNFMMM